MSDRNTGAPLPEAFVFGTKAETLLRLEPKVRSATVPRLYHFTTERWRREGSAVLEEIRERFGDELLVVRSSALIEDGAASSHAGEFASILKVRCGDAEFPAAVETVIESMTDNPRDQVMVQLMAQDTVLSGVIMTYDMVHGSPYYCIEYEDETGRTDGVTAGAGIYKGLYVYRHSEPDDIRSPRIAAILGLAREIEQLCGCAALDIEFGMDGSGQLWLFQVRRIALAYSWHPSTEMRVQRQLRYVDDFIRERSHRRSGVLGERTILAVMPDWNPAEIIGTTPRPLAASLYRELVTRDIWQIARAAMGYREVPGELMVLLGAYPYIDVRLSFNSFLPAGLPDAIGEKLVNAWLDRLEQMPELHDKVEFEIVPTCLDFCFGEDFAARYPGLLTDAELAAYRGALRDLTADCLAGAGQSSLGWAMDRAEKMTDDAPAVSGPEQSTLLARAVALVNRCRETGTLPFAMVARHAFIAESLLRSAVRRGALEEARLAQLRRSIRTVTGEMVHAYGQACRDDCSRADFLAAYGHLRPGTYEITSLRYDEKDDLFDADPEVIPAQESVEFTLTAAERQALDELLAESGLTVLDAEGLLQYARTAIAGRESVKFAFTRVLSDALDSLVEWGNVNGLSRDDLSYIPWPEFADCMIQPFSDYVDRLFMDRAEAGRRKLGSAQAFRFSHIIFDVSNLHVATQNRSVPNFIGTGKASGKLVEIGANTSANIYIKECIVCVESADPGFDWIFTKAPRALITKFGGANSHMAIRCAELGIPAAIGCGDQLYDRIVSADQVELDCAHRVLKYLGGD